MNSMGNGTTVSIPESLAHKIFLIQVIYGWVLSAGFEVFSCGKSPIDQNPRASEMYGSLSSWFILGRKGAQEI